MRIVLCVLFLAIANNGFAQNLEKDTIQLKEVLVTGKKAPKLKTVKKDIPKLRIITLMYAQQSSGIYLVDNLPVGNIKEITLFFSFIKKKYILENNVSKEHINLTKNKIKETRYEVSFYKVDSDNKVGEKINNNPLLIDIPESSSWKEKKIVLDVSSLAIDDTRFFVQLTRISDVPCDECFFYSPVLYDCGKKRSFYQALDEIVVDDKSTAGNGVITALSMGIKTLTRDY